MNTIDADGHIVEKDADVAKYLSQPHSKRGRPLLPSDGMDTGMGGLVGGLEDCDVATRLKDMDKEGIDVSVLFPTSSFAVNRLIERNYAVAYARAYNDFIAEVCRQSPRLKGIALLPFQDPTAAVEEANRAVTKLGLSAIAVATQGMKEHLGSASFRPIYEELQRLNVPLCVHNRREGPARRNPLRQFHIHAYHRAAGRDLHPVRRPDLQWYPGTFSRIAHRLLGMRRGLDSLLDGTDG